MCGRSEPVKPDNLDLNVTTIVFSPHACHACRRTDLHVCKAGVSPREGGKWEMFKEEGFDLTKALRRGCTALGVGSSVHTNYRCYHC